MGDVDGEVVFVHAVEVGADDAEFAVVFVKRVGVVVGVFVEQRVAQLDEFLHHTEQVGAAAAGGVDYADVVKRAGYGGLFGAWEVGGVAVVHEGGDGGRAGGGALAL